MLPPVILLLEVQVDHSIVHTLYDNPEGMKMIYAMLKTFNVQVCMSQYC